MTEQNSNNVRYNTDDLKFADYEYEYDFYYYDSQGENQVFVSGKRRGILYPVGEYFVDLIGGFRVKEEDIINIKDFGLEDTKLTIEQIRNVFTRIEKIIEISAYERSYKRTERCGNLYSCVPYSVSFKATESKYGLRDEFEKNAIEYDLNKEPKCEIDRWAQKIKSLFKKK